MNPPEDDIKNKVLNAIQTGEVKQRPRWYFLLRGTLFGIGLGIVLCLALYLVSFILFILRQTGLWFAPTFGFRGWFAFLGSLPWLLIGLCAVFVIVLELLVRRYEFAYQEPLSYSVIAVILVVAGGSILVFETSVHRTLFAFAEHQELPSPVTALYRGFGEEQFSAIHPGEIVATTSDGFIIQESRDDATESVMIASDTQIPPEAGFMPSDTVVVFGDESGTVIEAIGIEKIGSDVIWVENPSSN